eukprot:754971-Hanusia_phi.AAC.4
MSPSVPNWFSSSRNMPEKQSRMQQKAAKEKKIFLETSSAADSLDECDHLDREMAWTTLSKPSGSRALGAPDRNANEEGREDRDDVDDDELVVEMLPTVLSRVKAQEEVGEEEDDDDVLDLVQDLDGFLQALVYRACSVHVSLQTIQEDAGGAAEAVEHLQSGSEDTIQPLLNPPPDFV